MTTHVFEPPGQAGRRTGFRMTRTPKKDKNGLEDLDDFFHSDGDDDEASHNPKISTQSQKSSQLERLQRNVPQEYASADDDSGSGGGSGGDSDGGPNDSHADAIIQEASVFGSPIKVKKKATSRASALTKDIALHKKSRKRVYVDNDDEDDVIEPAKRSKTKGDEPDVKAVPLIERLAEAAKSAEVKSEEEESADKATVQTSVSSPKVKTVKHSPKAENPRVKAEPKAPKTKAKVKAKAKANAPAEQPTRRSSRTRVKPVAWWRSEKVVYKTHKENGAYVMEVEDVVHKPVSGTSKSKIEPDSSDGEEVNVDVKSEAGEEHVSVPKSPSEEPVTPVKTPKTAKKAPKKTPKETPKKTPKKTPKSVKSPKTPKATPKKAPKKTPKKTPNKASRKPSPVPLEEEGADGTGWMADEGLTVSVFEGPGSETQTERTVAWTPQGAKNISIIRNGEEYFKVRTLFDQDSEFSGAGILEIPVNSRKAVKTNEDTYFIFYVIEGTLEVTLSHNVFTVTTGCSFEVPMGNFYQFENRGEVPAKLFFTQSKYVVIDNPDEDIV